jgi:glutathione S-transferase
MKLYYAVGSSSLFPHIVLHESALPFEAIRINEHTKEMAVGGNYRTINSLGTVPALVLDDGTLITEGAVIAQYIADRVPEKNLTPPYGTIQRIRLQSWLNFISSEMHKGGFSPLFYKGIPEAGRDVFRVRLKARFAHIDQHLAENDYLLGQSYSIADAHLYVVSNWASWTNFDLSPYGRITAFRERVISRPAVVTALTAEGLVPWPTSQPH